MNFKKIAATLAAGAVAASALFNPVSALDSKNYMKLENANKNTLFYVDGDSKAHPCWSQDTGIDKLEVYGITFYITGADPAEGFGGGIGVNSNSAGWAQHEWGNDGAGKEITSDGKTVTYLSDKPAFAADDEYAEFFIQGWWGNYKITGADVLGKGGTVLKPEEKPAEEAPDAANGEEAPAEEKEKPAKEKPAKEKPAKEEAAEAVVEDEAAPEIVDETDEEAAFEVPSFSFDSLLTDPVAASLIENATYLGSGTSSNWGQAVKCPTYNNIGEDEEPGEDAFDSSLINPDNVVVVFYSSDSAPEFILQSWSGGEGWAKVPPMPEVSIDGVAVFSYEYMTAMYQSEDLSTLDCVYVGDTGTDLTVLGAFVADKNTVMSLLGLAAPAAEEEAAPAEEVTVEEAPAVVEEAPAPAPAPAEATTPATTGNAPVAVILSVMALAGCALAVSKRK